MIKRNIYAPIVTYDTTETGKYDTDEVTMDLINRIKEIEKSNCFGILRSCIYVVYLKHHDRYDSVIWDPHQGFSTLRWLGKSIIEIYAIVPITMFNFEDIIGKNIDSLRMILSHNKVGYKTCPAIGEPIAQVTESGNHHVDVDYLIDPVLMSEYKDKVYREVRRLHEAINDFYSYTEPHTKIESDLFLSMEDIYKDIVDVIRKGDQKIEEIIRNNQ